jgi:hypothetical protein
MNQDQIDDIVFVMILVTLLCTIGTAFAVGFTIDCIKDVAGQKWQSTKQKINTIFSVLP